jgi:hypothetical protein
MELWRCTGAAIKEDPVDKSVRHRDSAIVALVSRSTVRIEHARAISGDARSLWQRLDKQLMMASFAGCRPVAIREQSDQRHLHD